MRKSRLSLHSLPQSFWQTDSPNLEKMIVINVLGDCYNQMIREPENIVYSAHFLILGNQATTHCLRDCVGSIVGLKFVENFLNVIFNGEGAHFQQPGNGPI